MMRIVLHAVRSGVLGIKATFNEQRESIMIPVVFIAKVKNSEALRSLARCYKYRRHAVILLDYDSVELTGGSWSGGSRSYYSLFTPPNKIESIAVDRNPPCFGGGPIQTYQIPRGSYLVEGGIFCGKKAHLHIYGVDAIEHFTES
jgi:hypothetical protein